MGIAVQTQVDIPQQINLPRVSESNVVNLQQLNVALFPIKYSINFYKQVLSGETIGRLATVDKNKCVGAIVGRLQPLDFTAKCPKSNFNSATETDMYIFRNNQEFSMRVQNELYLMTLGVLPFYRNFGIATKLLDCLIKDFKKMFSISQVTLHVQVNNHCALKFYKKYGFSITSTVTDYYKNICPHDAYLLTLKV
ncbi:N-alpha-acetyltransferase 50 [Smittium culicis]|uniref:N-alpha-acetyltransferase 50 n=1 Tax=Smittium culicis TaxID=133412 RepID=A0A1R1YG70_9FUNG|nr:N-alpha-acetyltransferase 50 [Smittium culicis]